MPGRPEFSQPGTQGGGQSVAVNNRPEIVTRDYNQTHTQGAGSGSTVNVYAPEGSVWRVQAMQLKAPSIGGDGTGSHYFTVKSANHIRSMYAESADDALLEYDHNDWTATENQIPVSDTVTLLSLKELIATENQPLTILYFNDSASDQTNQRTVRFVFEEVSY